MNKESDCRISVLVRTTLRPSLVETVHSIFAQDIDSGVQILIGPDAEDDGRGMIESLRAACPKGMRLDVLDPGYPTSRQKGGLYSNRFGGITPVLLAYAALGRWVIFLDDDNWLAPDHLSSLAQVMPGYDWAFSLRWYVDGAKPLCVDKWESVGPGRGVYARSSGGFVDLNCLMFDKLACHFSIPWLGLALAGDGSGEGRLFFHALQQKHSVAWTCRPSVYSRIHRDDAMSAHRRRWLLEQGIVWP